MILFSRAETRRRIDIVCWGTLIAASLWAATTTAADYPARTIRIVTSGAGGANDIVSRLVGGELTKSLGQAVIVENRGGEFAAIQEVAQAQADGYTLLMYGNPLWTSPLLQKTPYDPIRDFAPVASLAKSPKVLVVNPSLGVNSIKDLIALAKSKPGELNYATQNTGGSTHIAAELFKSMAGVNIVRVSYNSGNQLMQDVVAGRVQLTFNDPAVVAPFVKSGKLKALGVTSDTPTALAPGLPTIAEAGLPGYKSSAFWGFFVPAKTDVAVITRLNQETNRILSAKEMKDRLFNTGVEVLVSSPAELGEMIKTDMASSGKAIKDAGIKIE